MESTPTPLAYNFPRLKDKHGVPSTALTFSVISFLLVSLWFVLWVVLSPFGINIPPFSASEAALFLSVSFALHWGREHDKSKIKVKNNEQNMVK